MARPAGTFDARRYFRGDRGLRFYNVGTARMRRLAKDTFRATRATWQLADAVAFADVLIADPYLETKAVGIEVLALYRRAFTPRLLATVKAWLARGDAGNWATTDAICGELLGPLLVAHPDLVGRLRAWARHRSLWVRRASVVGLIPPVRKGAALDVLYANARTLESDRHDLIHKACGWALREAGKIDSARLERYLRDRGARLPRTTVRYAVERFDEARRRAVLAATRG
jgi:3-methyladenine DNA glycosylase AlkD